MKTLFTQNERKELFPGGFKPVYFALAVYVLLVPVAYLFSMEAPGRKDWPLWSYTAVMHALMSALVGIVCKVVVSIVEEWIPKSRLRPYTRHIRNFIGVLAVWPFCIAVIMIIWKFKHG